MKPPGLEKKPGELYHFAIKSNQKIHPKFSYHFIKNPYNTKKYHPVHRTCIYKTINTIFQALEKNYYVTFIMAITYNLDLLRFLHKKMFITEFSFLGPNEYIVYLNRIEVNESETNVSLPMKKIHWISKAAHPKYFNHIELRDAMRSHSNGFGLVLTEKGFSSALDCIIDKRGGELIAIFS